MPVYQQMGHHSANLLDVPELSMYKGAILSPVNYGEPEMKSLLQSIEDQSTMESVFDPQLYYPRSNRGKLPDWDYFPDDVDTADVSSEGWWFSIADRIAACCERLKPTSACSPVLAPRAFTEEYYDMMTAVGNYFATSISNAGIRPIQTAVVGLAGLADINYALRVASILSRARAGSIYLIFYGETAPRRELTETDELKGAMVLINALARIGLETIVGFCSSEFILWKAAGAQVCATGKFFNLRRFTSSRFEEPSKGGGQLPYWFEETMLAFLRESDLIRVADAGFLNTKAHENPFGIEILEQLRTEPEKAWLALSWKQYLFAFADLESRIVTGKTDVHEILKAAERIWLELDNNAVLMEEVRNNGEWVRPWRRALLEYRRDHHDEAV